MTSVHRPSTTLLTPPAVPSPVRHYDSSRRNALTPVPVRRNSDENGAKKRKTAKQNGHAGSASARLLRQRSVPMGFDQVLSNGESGEDDSLLLPLHPSHTSHSGSPSAIIIASSSVHNTNGQVTETRLVPASFAALASADSVRAEAGDRAGGDLNQTQLAITSEDWVDQARNKEEWQGNASDALQSVVTALYCKILVILGLAFPMSEVISDNVPMGYYQLFYVFLFLGCLFFLLLIYVDLLRTRAAQNLMKRRNLKNKLKRKKQKKEAGGEGGGVAGGVAGDETAAAETEEADEDDQDVADRLERKNLLPRPRVHYGSFYLRLGAVLFGIGSMIYSGIEIGMFFELNMDKTVGCKNLFSVLRPILQMLFVFVQMYFIFLNQKMNIYKNKFVSRFGLMHMIATNLCVWLNVLILETSHEILDGGHHDMHHMGHIGFGVGDVHGPGGRGHAHGNVSGAHNDDDDDLGHDAHGAIARHFTDDASSANHDPDHSLPLIQSNYFDMTHLTTLCTSRNYPNARLIMSKLLADSGPFLFPCTIEYSLICAAVLYIMWKNIAEEHEHYKFQKRRRKITKRMNITRQQLAAAATSHAHGDLDPQTGGGRSAHHYSIDCTRANTGLFTGIFVMVLTIISIIVYFVLISSDDEELQDLAITVASYTELFLYSITTTATLLGMLQVSQLWYDTSRKLELDNLLLVVAQTGVFIYAAFCIIGSFFQLQDHMVAFLASLATLTQTTLQTIFILDASNRYAYNEHQVKKKPGREVVTFLLVCNLAMWAINTLETNRAESHPIQVKFYGGDWAWPIITHISMPLAIFYRFHSTVCLCEIWKKSFKYKATSLNYV